MRVVLDTNVLVSAFLTPRGNCRRIVDLVLRREVELVVDARILEEYHGVLSRPRLGLPWRRVRRSLVRLSREALQVAAVSLPLSLPDPDDAPFIEVARAAAAILVTGNPRHFPVESRLGVTVMSPREFMDQLSESSA